MELAKSMMNNVWMERSKYAEAERMYQEHLAKSSGVQGEAAVVSEDSSSAPSLVKNLQDENSQLKKQMAELLSKFAALEVRLSDVENKCGVSSSPVATQQATPAAAAADDDEDDDDDDLFASDSEDDEKAAKLKEERLAMYAAKKSKKQAIIAKSNIVLDVKPWDDETDMAELERCVRSVETDGLVWGASKLIKIAYGITKLQIVCVVEDDKVGTDFLEEEITAFGDYIQSVDVAAFNKV